MVSMYATMAWKFVQKIFSLAEYWNLLFHKISIRKNASFQKKITSGFNISLKSSISINFLIHAKKGLSFAVHRYRCMYPDERKKSSISNDIPIKWRQHVFWFLLYVTGIFISSFGKTVCTSAALLTGIVIFLPIYVVFMPTCAAMMLCLLIITIALDIRLIIETFTSCNILEE